MTKLEGFDRIIGMDLSKRTYKACVLTRERNFEDRKVLSGRMDASGRQNFISTLGPNDIVAIEGGTSSNNFARELEEKAGMVFLLNPGKLHIIFQSQRKTDKVDAVKIARYVRDTHEDSICSMNIPTRGESEIRQIVNSYNFAKKQRTQLINKLHSIFNMNGYPEVKKSDLERNESRVSVITDKLEGLVCQDATMVEELVTSVRLRIEKYIDIMRQYILDNPEVALPWLSLPGIGLIEYSRSSAPLVTT